MTWASKNKDAWNQNQEEIIAINSQNSFFKMLLGFGTFSNFFIYQAFLTGIYNYR